MGNGNFQDFCAAIHDPQTVHGMVEDYRAGLKIDRTHDEEDRVAGRKITCPTQVLWSQHDDLEFRYGDVLDVWRAWSTDLCGHGLPCGHHMAEEIPELLTRELAAFHERHQ